MFSIMMDQAVVVAAIHILTIIKAFNFKPQMMITELTIRKPKEGKFNAKNLVYRIDFTGTDKDTTGLGGSWESSGSLHDVYQCDDYFVLTNILNSAPVFVCYAELTELISFLKMTYKTKVTAV